MVSIRRLKSWDGLVPEWVESNGRTWLSRGTKIFRADALDAIPVHVATVPIPNWKRVLEASSLARRLLRISCYNVAPIGEVRLFVSFDKSVLVFDGGRWTEIAGLAKQFRILRGCCALTLEGDLFFGEYFPNAARTSSVNVYRLRAGSIRAEIVWTFAPGEIRHIHGIHWDPFGRALWLCTGDLPSECRIIRTRDCFGSIETIGAGDESWRTIFLIFKMDSIYYATDSEFQPNFIYRIDRNSGRRETITGIDGPSYYGTEVGGYAVFATTVELCPSQNGREAVIWAVDDAHQTRMLGSFAKDLFGSRALIPFFQAGLVLFASATDCHAESPFTGSGLVGLNGRMFAISGSRD